MSEKTRAELQEEINELLSQLGHEKVKFAKEHAANDRLHEELEKSGNEILHLRNVCISLTADTNYLRGMCDAQMAEINTLTGADRRVEPRSRMGTRVERQSEPMVFGRETDGEWRKY